MSGVTLAVLLCLLKGVTVIHGREIRERLGGSYKYSTISI